MEIRSFAERALLATSLEAKLAAPGDALTDDAPGPPLSVAEPGRPPELRIAPRRTAPAMPAPGALAEPYKRGVAHHILANHELQAVEVMAMVLCVFPDAPPAFRTGLVDVIRDEQRHTRMHVERAAKLGVRFGDLPVNGYIWKKSLEFKSILDYLAGMPLLFEHRNLDHTLEFAGYFEAAGDDRSAALMRVIHRDEIEHVRFGVEWLRRLKPAGVDDWEVWQSHLAWPLRPTKARGEVFAREPRLAAGLSEEFITRLERADDADDAG